MRPLNVVVRDITMLKLSGILSYHTHEYGLVVMQYGKAATLYLK